MEKQHYERATVRDYGSLVDLTRAISINGTEDGGSKVAPMHHSTPAQP